MTLSYPKKTCIWMISLLVLTGCTRLPSNESVTDEIDDIIEAAQLECDLKVTAAIAGEGDDEHAYFIITIRINNSPNLSRSEEVLVEKYTSGKWELSSTSKTRILTLSSALCETAVNEP